MRTVEVKTVEGGTECGLSLRTGPAAVAAYGQRSGVLSKGDVRAILGRLTGKSPSGDAVDRWIREGLKSNVDQSCVKLGTIAMPSGHCVTADQLVAFISGLNDVPEERESAALVLRQTIAAYLAETSAGRRPALSAEVPAKSARRADAPAAGRKRAG